jgi:hypothetical protein
VLIRRHVGLARLPDNRRPLLPVDGEKHSHLLLLALTLHRPAVAHGDDSRCPRAVVIGRLRRFSGCGDGQITPALGRCGVLRLVDPLGSDISPLAAALSSTGWRPFFATRVFG